MQSFSAIRRELADAIKERGVERLVYFHCDHFEPWSTVDDRAIIDPRAVDDVQWFAEDCSRLDYARKLTLFYASNYFFVYDLSRELIRAYPGDLIGFAERTPREEEAFRAAMKYLVDTVDHEIQIHIHHEGFTSNTSHRRPEAVAYFSSEEACRGDAARLALALRLAKKAILRETDRKLARWFFVHGLWSLQGSDASCCTISDEISVLMREGCRGDFTFPAGRAHVNPQIEEPFFCDAIDALRGYDLAESNPERAWRNGAAASDKFFVWSAPNKHALSSIDYYDPGVRQRLEQPARWASEIVRSSYAVDGTLFVKTHAHSMYPDYRAAKRRPVPPHCHPGVQTLLSLVFDGAAQAGAEVAFATADEIYEMFVSAELRVTAPAPSENKVPAPHPVAASSPAAKLAGKEAVSWQASLAEYLKARTIEPRSPAASPTAEAAVVAAAAVRAPVGRYRPLSTAAAAGIVDRVGIAVMADRIEKFGAYEAGAYGYYQRKVTSGAMLGEVEINLAEFMNKLPWFDEFHDVGAGLGLLAMLVALCGHRSLVIERDPRRFAAAEAVHRQIGAQQPDFAALCELAHGAFPEVVADRDVGSALAIFTNFVATFDEKKILAGIRRYAAALIDIDRFGVQLENAEQHRAVVARISAAGFRTVVPVLDLGARGRYYIVSDRAFQGLPVLQEAEAALAD